MTAKNKQGYVYSKVNSDGDTYYLFKGKGDRHYVRPYWLRTDEMFWMRTDEMFRGEGRTTRPYAYVYRSVRELKETQM